LFGFLGTFFQATGTGTRRLPDLSALSDALSEGCRRHRGLLAKDQQFAVSDIAARQFRSRIADLFVGPPRRRRTELVDSARLSDKAEADAFLVPVAWKKVPRTEQTVSDPDLVAQVREATGIFLIGGEQDKIVKALFTSDGEQSPMLKAMWEVYRNGASLPEPVPGSGDEPCHVRDAESVLDTMLKVFAGERNRSRPGVHR